MDQVWSDKVKADRIQETIKTAMNEVHKGKFEEIKEVRIGCFGEFKIWDVGVKLTWLSILNGKFN